MFTGTYRSLQKTDSFESFFLKVEPCSASMVHISNLRNCAASRWTYTTWACTRARGWRSLCRESRSGSSRLTPPSPPPCRTPPSPWTSGYPGFQHFLFSSFSHFFFSFYFSAVLRSRSHSWEAKIKLPPRAGAVAVAVAEISNCGFGFLLFIKELK